MFHPGLVLQERTELQPRLFRLKYHYQPPLLQESELILQKKSNLTIQANHSDPENIFVEYFLYYLQQHFIIKNLLYSNEVHLDTFEVDILRYCRHNTLNNQLQTEQSFLCCIQNTDWDLAQYLQFYSFRSYHSLPHP